MLSDLEIYRAGQATITRYGVGRGSGFWPGRRLFLALVAGCLLAQPTLAWAGAFSDCVEDVVARDLAATVAFQRGLRDLALRDKPEFEALASLNMELQIAMFEARALETAYLARRDPARIKTAEGLSAFRNYDWTEQDGAALARESSDYRAHRENVALLRASSDGHPDWPALRDHFGKQVRPDPAFKALMARLTESTGALGARVRFCRAD